jgi:hypothetical protein
LRKIIVIYLAFVRLEERCNTNTLALLHSRVALEDTPALIAEDKIAATVHGIAPRGSFDPKPALWALPHLLLNSKCDKQLVRLIHIAVFRLVLLAAHAGMPATASSLLLVPVKGHMKHVLLKRQEALARARSGRRGKSSCCTLGKTTCDYPHPRQN